MTTKAPYDTILAAGLARVLARTPITPNMATTASLLLGLTAAALFASGERPWIALGGLLFMLACLGDHVDGELARLTKRTSAFGHYYDRVASATVYTTGFLGIGIGQQDSALGSWSVALGLAAGVSIGLVFALRNVIEHRHGKESVKQRAVAGFETEDILYLVGPVAWLDWLVPLVVAGGFGAPLYLLLSLVARYRRAD